MPSYYYKAKKESAETVTGYITANDSDEAIELVTEMGLLPVEVEEASHDGALVKAIKARTINPKEMYMFTRQLGSLLKSGLPLLKALDALLAQMKNRYFQSILSMIIVEVRNGRSFSEALNDSHVFPPLYVAMATAGEETGRLHVMIQNLATYQKMQQELMSKVRSALAYPILMVVVGIGTITFILMYVMPKISVLFNNVNAELPWPTQIVLAASHFMQSFWILGVFALLGIAIFWRVIKQTTLIKNIADDLMMQFPSVRQFFIKIEMERFCRTLKLLMQSGVSIIKAIEIAIPTLSNTKLQRELLKSQEELTQGEGFGEALSRISYIPDIIGQLISVGEESGSLDDALGDIADTYAQEIEETTKAFTSLLEPLMILFVGLIVGFIILAMLLPIFQMDVLAR